MAKSNEFNGVMNFLKVNDLKILCQNLGIKRSGTRDELIRGIKKKTKRQLVKLVLNMDLSILINIAEKLNLKADKDRLSLQIDIINHLMPETFKKQDKKIIITKEYLKENLQEFFQITKKQSFNFPDSTNEEIKLNKYIFEIENYISGLKSEYGIKDNFEPKIISDSIINSFNSETDSKDYFRSADYQLSVLDFLSNKMKNITQNYQLIDLANDYFKQPPIVNLLKYPDILLLKTGGTRCKENFNNAVGQLCKLGLLKRETKSQEEQEKYYPTYFGITILAYILKNYEKCRNNCKFYFSNMDVDIIKLPTKFRKGISFHPVIFHSIEEINNNPDNFIQYIDYEMSFLKHNDIKLAYDLLKDYYDFIIEKIVLVKSEDCINYEKIKIKDDKINDIEAFFEKIKVKKGYKKLFNELLSHYGYPVDDTTELFDSY